MAEFELPQHDSPLRHLDFESSGSLLFSVSLTIFILVFAAFGGLILLNRSRTSELDALARQNQVKEEALHPELLEAVTILDKRLRNMRSLLGGHVFGSNAFKVLEQTTHPQVQFSIFNFAVEDRKVGVSGSAPNFTVLSHQIGILERDPQVESVEFGGLSLRERTIGFTLSIIFKPGLLLIRP